MLRTLGTHRMHRVFACCVLHVACCILYCMFLPTYGGAAGNAVVFLFGFFFGKGERGGGWAFLARCELGGCALSDVHCMLCFCWDVFPSSLCGL